MSTEKLFYLQGKDNPSKASDNVYDNALANLKEGIVCGEDFEKYLVEQFDPTYPYKTLYVINKPDNAVSMHFESEAEAYKFFRQEGCDLSNFPVPYYPNFGKDYIIPNTDGLKLDNNDTNVLEVYDMTEAACWLFVAVLCEGLDKVDELYKTIEQRNFCTADREAPDTIRRLSKYMSGKKWSYHDIAMAPCRFSRRGNFAIARILNLTFNDKSYTSLLSPTGFVFGFERDRLTEYTPLGNTGYTYCTGTIYGTDCDGKACKYIFEDESGTCQALTVGEGDKAEVFYNYFNFHDSEVYSISKNGEFKEHTLSYMGCTYAVGHIERGAIYNRLLSAIKNSRERSITLTDGSDTYTIKKEGLMQYWPANTSLDLYHAYTLPIDEYAHIMGENYPELMEAIRLAVNR